MSSTPTDGADLLRIARTLGETRALGPDFTLLLAEELAPRAVLAGLAAVTGQLLARGDALAAEREEVFAALEALARSPRGRPLAGAFVAALGHAVVARLDEFAHPATAALAEELRTSDTDPPQRAAP